MIKPVGFRLLALLYDIDVRWNLERLIYWDLLSASHTRGRGVFRPLSYFLWEDVQQPILLVWGGELRQSETSTPFKDNHWQREARDIWLQSDAPPTSRSNS